MRFSYKKDVLDNGIRIVSESGRNTGSISLGFWVGIGASCEPSDLNGVSHFIEHILFKGTRKRSAYDIANALESVGGSIDAFTGRETTAFVSRCLPEHMRRAVDVISDMLSRPAMKSEDIDIEKRVVFEEIRNHEDTPEDVVYELIAKSVWNRNSFGQPVLGTANSVKRFRRETLFPFFRSFYVCPNIIVGASGKVDHDRLVDYVGRMLSVPKKSPPRLSLVRSSGIPKVYQGSRNVSQCYICIGVETPPYHDRTRYATVLLSMILGGGMTSRLFQEVREKEGLAYSVYCSCDFYRSTGLFVVFLAVDPKKARRSVGCVARELRRLKAKGFRKGELRNVKRQLKGGILLGLESTAARMNRLVRQEFYLNEYHSIEKSLKMISRVRHDDVMNQAHQLLQPSKCSLVTVGPSKSDFPKRKDLYF